MSSPPGAQRLQVADDRDLWCATDQVVQSTLAALDGVVRAAIPHVRVRPGSNRGRAWLLFSYRVFESPPETGIDPVVVGLNVAESIGSLISVHGDICGETLGDVILDLPVETATEAPAVKELAREVASRLATHGGLIIGALRDASRQQ